ncbi:hypothetical protein F4678DRAFT_451258 [Xylaria arbuscula]|nr:hypothetical protein F4678DRAFT_451258 [Xylaria arbuscula]
MLPDAALPRSAEDVGLLTPSEKIESTEEGPMRSRDYGCLPVLISVLTASLVANAILLWAWVHEHALATSCKSPLAGLRPNKLTDFNSTTIWGDASNITALDELWYTMDVNAGIIQLPKQSHLGSTQDFPWDKTRGLYILNSYHSLHCLQIVYTYIRQQEEADVLPEYTIDHVAHCLGVIRSDVMCEADDTLFPYEVQQTIEKPPERICRNWEKLEEFAIQNSACFQRLKDSDPLHGTLFEYMNCPPGSPYHALVEELKHTNGTSSMKVV